MKDAQTPKGLGGVGGTGGATPHPDTSPAGDDGDARRVAHELLGQTHGLMFIAMDEDNIRVWCPAELQEVVRNSAPKLWLAFGQAQAEVASGLHDARLAETGTSGELAAPKRRGLARAVETVHRAFAAVAERIPRKQRRLLQNAITWARGPIGSMSFIPGVEIIGEALDVTQAALGQMDIAENTE